MRLELNPKQLKVFYHVGKHLSFTKAAQELYVTQPAVAMQVKAWSTSCGCALVVRRNSRLELTEAGATLFVYSERLVGVLRGGRAGDSEARRGPRSGAAHRHDQDLGALPHAGLRDGLPARLPPRTHRTLDASSADIAAAVAKGECDLGIVGRVPVDDRLLAIPFPGHEIDELVLVLPPDHRWAERETVTSATSWASASSCAARDRAPVS